MKKFVTVIFIISLFSSCTTLNKNNPYPDMKTLTYNGNFAYEFKSKGGRTDKLIMVFEGSGWGSSLGLYEDNEWRFTGTGAQLIQALRSDYTILMPEKWNRVPGINYIDDMNARLQYTKENLIECYVSTIDNYIAENNFSGVFLIGTSEGAAVLPLVYESMKNKSLVKGMVSVAAGGLSIYESYLINIEKENISDFWKDAYSYSIRMQENLEEYYESTEKTPMGLVHRQMASFLNLRPFDYYVTIDIPVLFIHGKKDLNIAVESTMYIKENLPAKPFEYIIYEDMGHIPMNDPERDRFRADIEKWIRHNS